jgi:hypothetical protein
MDEITLEAGVEFMFDPAGVTTVIQNTMPSSDDVLYVSKTAATTRTWMKVESDDSVKFATVVFLKQIGRPAWVFPVYEIV